jgi:hypothetical protein
MPNEKGKWALSIKAVEESNEELLRRVNTKIEQANPQKQAKVPAPIDLKAVRASVTDEEAFKVLNSQLWNFTLGAIAKGDFEQVNSNIKAMIAGGALSKESAGKLDNLLKATVPDPTYKARVNISLANIAGYEQITAEDLV